jgi:hypothetical protein
MGKLQVAQSYGDKCNAEAFEAGPAHFSPDGLLFAHRVSVYPHTPTAACSLACHSCRFLPDPTLLSISQMVQTLSRKGNEWAGPCTSATFKLQEAATQGAALQSLNTNIMGELKSARGEVGRCRLTL